MEQRVAVYDTTLRDGTQGEQVSFSAEDKVRILRRLDDMGFHYIEGGWPGSNPKDRRFFHIASSVPLQNAKLAAFGSTRKPSVHPGDDENVRTLLESDTPVVTIFGKTWDLHVEEILGTTFQENCAMIGDTVAFFKDHGREVLFDAEHFFDGYVRNAEYAMRTLDAAARGGADLLVLCDTNGGTLPQDLARIVREVRSHTDLPLGIHAHNDCGLAVANSMAAVLEGATMVQGTVNGYGERCGNADLITVVPNLEIKMGCACLPRGRIRHLTELSRYVSELANQPPVNQRPYTGRSAFAHKGGVHVSAVMKNPSAYEHVDPSDVGNRRRVLISDLSGKSNVTYMAQERGIDLGGNGVDSKTIVQEVKRLEDRGYQFDAAEGSFELLVKKMTGQLPEPFSLEHFRVIIEKNGEEAPSAQATIKISVGSEHEITAAEGTGPVNALDNALRKALYRFFPELEGVRLVDYKVRVLEGTEGTGAVVRVLIESRDDKNIWSTIGVSTDIIEASWQALVDSIQYRLIRPENE